MGAIAGHLTTPHCRAGDPKPLLEEHCRVSCPPAIHQVSSAACVSGWQAAGAPGRHFLPATDFGMRTARLLPHFAELNDHASRVPKKSTAFFGVPRNASPL